jgi:DNA-binding transcriptional MerR regulator
MSIEIPDKLYFKIGEVSKLAGVAPHVLRYWESEFKEIQPKRANSNQRLYRREDVDTVVLIKTLLHERGFTLVGARKFLANKNKNLSLQKEVSTPNCLGTIKEELLAVKKMLNGEK